MQMERRSFACGNLGLEAAEVPAGLFRGNADDVAAEGHGLDAHAGLGKGSLVESLHFLSP
jgi:hypothetical protein